MVSTGHAFLHLHWKHLGINRDFWSRLFVNCCDTMRRQWHSLGWGPAPDLHEQETELWISQLALQKCRVSGLEKNSHSWNTGLLHQTVQLQVRLTRLALQMLLSVILTLAKKKNIWRLLQGVAPPTDLFFLLLKKKKGEREQRYKKHLSSLKKKNNSLGAGSCKRPAAGERFGQTS